MARLNIETKVFRAQGFQDLMIAVGNRHTAKGILWELFEVAQEYWFPKMELIPIEVFRARGLPEVLFAPGGLAELQDDKVYVRGSKDAFQWLFEKAEAGRKSGAARRKKSQKTSEKPSKPKKSKAKEQNEQVFSSVEQTGTNANEPEQTRTSLLSSLYSSLSTPNSLISTPNECTELADARPPAPVDSGVEVSGSRKVWQAYRTAYELRYRVAPLWNAKVGGQIKSFVTRVPMSEAPAIAAFYVSHNGARYVASAHMFGNLLMDAEKLRTEYMTGHKITSQDARSAEAGDSLRNQMERLARGAHE